MCLMITMTLLSVTVMIMNRILAWEVWMMPVIAAGFIMCWIVFLTDRLPSRSQIYIFGAFLIFLEFYYCIRIETIYDCGVVVLILITVFSFSREKLLIWSGTASAIFSLSFRLFFTEHERGLLADLPGLARTVMIFLMIPLAVFVVEYVVRVWDLTEKKYLERIELLEEENVRANSFLANVSHEVRTPVSAVIGLSHVLLKSELEEQDMDKVRSISAAGHRVAEQISDILDFTEVDMKKTAVSNESYEIASLLNDLLNRLSLSEDYGLELVLNVDPEIPTLLKGDETKIKRILWHLIRNGYKFTKDGGVCVHIYSVKRDYGINLVMQIKDTGSGMTEDEIEKSYEKFYQADSGRTRARGGLGLGLPIVAGFVKAMGGVFSIESGFGDGTEVKISIPQEVEDFRPCLSVGTEKPCVAACFLGFMNDAHPRIREYYGEMLDTLSERIPVPIHRIRSEEELKKLVSTTGLSHLFIGAGEYFSDREYFDSLSSRINVALVVRPGFAEETGQRIQILYKPLYGVQIVSFLNRVTDIEEDNVREYITFPGVKTLLVDDEHMNLVVEGELFSGYGMEISTAQSGEEAILMCSENHYDIVFMDHMMPGMDGVEAMHQIKHNAAKENREICVVALTANAISSARQMFLAEGFDGFVPKPIEINDLERVLKRVLPETAAVYSKEPLKKKRLKEKKPEVKTEENPEENPDAFAELKKCGLDTAQGLDYCGDEDFYKELLLDYADDSDSKVKTIEKYFEEKNWEDYMVRVHGVKSTSKMVGLNDLSSDAEALEFAVQAEDYGYIEKNHASFIESYAKILNLIRDCLGQTDLKEAQ